MTMFRAMFLIVVGALLGLLFGGAKGLVVGGILAYFAGVVGRHLVARKLENVRASFLDSTFAVMGALCKADGVVTRDEIRTVEAMFERLRFTEEQKAAAKAAFNRGKAPDFDLDGQVRAFATTVGARGVLLQLFLQLQLTAVTADGAIHPAERTMLVSIARTLGLGDLDIARLEALLRAASAGPFGEAGAPHAPPSRDRLQDAYTALGVSPEASDDEIKRAYRRMMRETHPDRLASQGLPEAMRQVAEERAREINAAFDLIKRARNFA